jgi:uncharacterized membrane protein
MTKTRLEAFSDAVIAIIITIMVLELKVPHDSSFNALLELWPVFLSYVVSFIMLGTYWGNHHHLIHTIKEVRGGILWANLHLLFWLSLIPFATAWMGENHFEKKTVAVYSLLADICGISYYILLLVIRNCNRDNHALQEVLRKQFKKGTLSCICYTAAIGLSFVDAWLGGLLIILVEFMWLMPDRNIERSIKE